MNEVLVGLEELGLQVVLCLFLSATVVFVLIANGRGLRRLGDSFAPSNGEKEIDRLSVRGLLGERLLIVTDQRVVVEKRMLLLSQSSRKFFPLADLHAVRTWSGLNLLLVGLAAWSLWLPVPLALLAWMVALESTVAWVGLEVAWQRAPFGRAGLLSLRRATYPEIHRFYSSLRRALTSFQGCPSGSDSSEQGADAGERFAWGRAVWLSTLLVLLGAIAQRFAFDHVGYDELWIAPLLLGAPVAAATLGLRDGAWAALLAWVAVHGTKFPAAGLHDGEFFSVQAGLVLVGVLMMGILAGFLGRSMHPSLAPLALLIWPMVVFADDRLAAFDLRTAIVVLASMAVAGLLSAAMVKGEGVPNGRKAARQSAPSLPALSSES